LISAIQKTDKFWGCLTDGCQGRIKTDANGIFVEFSNPEQWHPSNVENIEVCTIVSKMIDAYDAQPDVRLQVRQLMAFTFFPVAVVRLADTTLQLQAIPILQLLFQYFRQEWLTDKPTALWNVYNWDLHTNIDCEAWHL
jgi:hypothetical protein